MGHYTRIKFAAALRSDTPVVVTELLDAVAAGDWPRAESIAPKHPFFEASRWSGLLRGTYAAPSWPEADGRLTFQRGSEGMLQLSFHSSTKNYERELDKFCDWIAPYIASTPGEVVGEFESEDDEYERDPTLLIAQDRRIDKLYAERRASSDADGFPW